MKPEVALIGVAALWGSTFVVTKDVVRDAAPFQFLTLRFALGAAVLWVLYARRFPISRRAWRDGIVLGLLNSAGLALQVFGQVYTTASKSSFVTALNTPLTPLVALALYRTRPTRAQMIAVVLATIGVGLLTYPAGGAAWNTGDLLTVGCAAIYAITIVEIARRTPAHDAMALTCVQVTTAALLFATMLGCAHAALALLPRAPAMLLLEARPLHVTARLAAEVVYMAVVCTAVTFGGQTWAMARMSATTAAVIFALEPVFATTMAVLAGGASEWPAGRGAVGAALVLAGVLVSEMRLR
jgi:drug/metabolite transporter (DMT)-like permease